MHRKYILENIIKREGFVKIAELGVWKGATMQHLLTAFGDKINYIGVDLFDVQEDGECETYRPGENGHEWDHDKNYASALKFITDRNLQTSAQVWKMSTVEAAYDCARGAIEFDLVFIDADHSYNGVKSDIKHWLPLVREGGWLMGHDYSPKFPGVQRAVNEAFSRPQFFDDTVWGVKLWDKKRLFF